MRAARRSQVPGLASVLALLVLGLSAGAPEPAYAERKAEPIPGVDEALAKQIDQAIERGIAWVRTQQRKDGSFPGLDEGRVDGRSYSVMDLGLNALVAFTLAHGGATADDKAVKRILGFLQKHYSGDPTKGSMNVYPSGRLTVYAAATMIVAFDALYDPGHGKQPRVKRDRYGRPKPPRIRPCKYPKAIGRWIRQMVAFLVEAQVKPSGGWRYPGNPEDSEPADTDMSNTQYALLALDAAGRCGIEAPIETWLLAAEHVLREQEEDGLDTPVWIPNEAYRADVDGSEPFIEVGKARARGWAYLPGHTALPTGSMTAAGVTSLSLIKEHLWRRGKLTPQLRKRIEAGQRDGLAWLGDLFAVDRNPEPTDAPTLWHYYWLYGLERAGSKAGVRYMGKHDWYVEGARYLLGAQQEDGSWPMAGADGRPADHTESAMTQTCFAILFLRRSTPEPIAPMAPPVTGGASEPVDSR